MTFAAVVLAVMLGIIASLANAVYFSYEVPVVFLYIAMIIIAVGLVIIYDITSEM